jgi:hypothetical protein
MVKEERFDLSEPFDVRLSDHNALCEISLQMCPVDGELPISGFPRTLASIRGERFSKPPKDE